jgi:hypothetical protein
MTAQFGERLKYEGEDVTMATTPLDQYFREIGVAPPFVVDCSALWRGYIGSWEIRSNRLYLLSLMGRLEDGSDINLGKIFPNTSGIVFANWYSGKIRVPRGKRLTYVHQGFASTYEQEIIIQVKNGEVVSTEKISNVE